MISYLNEFNYSGAFKTHLDTIVLYPYKRQGFKMSLSILHTFQNILLISGEGLGLFQGSGTVGCTYAKPIFVSYTIFLQPIAIKNITLYSDCNYGH